MIKPICTHFGGLPKFSLAPVYSNELSLAHHKPEDSNADITTLARLGMIVEITVVVVAHALNVSGEAISIQTPWRPAEAFDPNPYTALSDFHRKVMTSAHPDLPHA